MKLKFGWRLAMAGCLLISLSHCGGDAQPKEKTPPTPITDPVDTNSAKAHAVGKYCFATDESNLNIQGSLELRADHSVEGNLKGSILQAGAESEGVWDTSFHGTLEGDALSVTTLSNESGTKEEKQEVWTWKGDVLVSGSHRLAAVACPQ